MTNDEIRGDRVISYTVTLLHRIYDLTIQRFNDSTWRSHSCFVILSPFVLIFPAASHAAENLGILGAHPKWGVLENYQATITHDDFIRLIRDVYCTHGLAPDLIEINEKTARILMNRDARKFSLYATATNRLRRSVRTILYWLPQKF